MEMEIVRCVHHVGRALRQCPGASKKMIHRCYMYKILFPHKVLQCITGFLWSFHDMQHIVLAENHSSNGVDIYLLGCSCLEQVLNCPCYIVFWSQPDHLESLNEKINIEMACRLSDSARKVCIIRKKALGLDLCLIWFVYFVWSALFTIEHQTSNDRCLLSHMKTKNKN